MRKVLEKIIVAVVGGLVVAIIIALLSGVFCQLNDSCEQKEFKVDIEGPTNLSIGDEGKFVAKLTGGSEPYAEMLWNFDEGSGLEPGAKEANHKFSRLGPHTISVTIKDGSGRNATDVHSTYVNPLSQLTAEIRGPNELHVGEPRTFRAEVSGGSGDYEYDWDFGDGIGSSTEKNPSYNYSKSGFFEVILRVSDGGRPIERTYEVYVSKVATILALEVYPPNTSDGFKEDDYSVRVAVRTDPSISAGILVEYSHTGKDRSWIQWGEIMTEAGFGEEQLSEFDIGCSIPQSSDDPYKYYVRAQFEGDSRYEEYETDPQEAFIEEGKIFICRQTDKSGIPRQ